METHTTEERTTQINGHPYAATNTLIILALCTFMVVVFLGAEGVLLFFFGVFPVLVILFGIQRLAENTLTKDLMLEMFWSGGTLSIALAVILEVIGQAKTSQAWKCINSTSGYCDASFVLVVIVTIGFAEEASKLAPLMRLRLSSHECPQSHSWWYRLCTTPFGFFLAGCSSGAGFACIENLKYVFAGEAFTENVATAFFRAFLAIPFHVACSGTSAGLLGLWLYPSAESDMSAGLLTGEPQNTPGPRSELYLTRVLIALGIPSFLHGIYDSGLFLASKYFNLANPDGAKPQNADGYLWIASSAVATSLLAYVTAIVVLLYVGWKTKTKTHQMRSHRTLVSSNSIEVAIVERLTVD